MRLVSYWRRAHKRNSVRFLILGTVLQVAGGAWSALPESYVRTLPVWVIFTVSGIVSAAGLIGAYTKQTSLERG